MEPDIELLIAEIDGIVRLLLSRCKFFVYQEYGDTVRDAKEFPELPFKQKFDWMLCLSMSGTCTLLATFLASTNRIGGSNASSC